MVKGSLYLLLLSLCVLLSLTEAGFFGPKKPAQTQPPLVEASTDLDAENVPFDESKLECDIKETSSGTSSLKSASGGTKGTQRKFTYDGDFSFKQDDSFRVHERMVYNTPTIKWSFYLTFDAAMNDLIRHALKGAAELWSRLITKPRFRRHGISVYVANVVPGPATHLAAYHGPYAPYKLEHAYSALKRIHGQRFKEYGFPDKLQVFTAAVKGWSESMPMHMPWAQLHFLDYAASLRGRDKYDIILSINRLTLPRLQSPSKIDPTEIFSRTAKYRDLDATIFHELGHAFGFNTRTVAQPVCNGEPTKPSVLDFFRHSSVNPTKRGFDILGPYHVWNDEIIKKTSLNGKLLLKSTGKIPGENSHWVDTVDSKSPYIGIMKSSAGRLTGITSADIYAFSAIGIPINPVPTPILFYVDAVNFDRDTYYGVVGKLFVSEALEIQISESASFPQNAESRSVPNYHLSLARPDSDWNLNWKSFVEERRAMLLPMFLKVSDRQPRLGMRRVGDGRLFVRVRSRDDPRKLVGEWSNVISFVQS